MGQLAMTGYEQPVWLGLRTMADTRRFAISRLMSEPWPMAETEKPGPPGETRARNG